MTHFARHFFYGNIESAWDSANTSFSGTFYGKFEIAWESVEAKNTFCQALYENSKMNLQSKPVETIFQTHCTCF